LAPQSPGCCGLSFNLLVDQDAMNMKLSQSDYVLWSLRNAPTWAAPFSEKVDRVKTIHEAINARGNYKKPRTLSMVNAVSLLHLVRKNIKTKAQEGTLSDYMYAYALRGDDGVNKRAHIYWRWYWRMRRN